MDAQEFSNRIFKITRVILLIGFVLFLVFGILFGQNFVLKFSIDGHLAPSTLEKISNFKILLFVFSGFLLFLTLILNYFRGNVIKFIEIRQELIKSIILLLALILIILIGGELICRMIFYESTSNFGMGPGTLRFLHKYTSINSEGVRDFNYDYAKENNTVRIAVLGDSYTFGYGIKNIRDVYPKLIESKLNGGNYSFNYEVLNFGIPGWDIEMEADTLRKNATKYRPDIVIIGYNLNDFINVEPKINYTSKFEAKTMPGFYWLRRGSYFYFYLETHLNIISHMISQTVFKTRTYEQALADYYLSSENLEYNRKIWKDINKIGQDKNITVVVAVLPMIPILQNYSLIGANEVVRKLCLENGFYFIDLLEDYRNYPPKELMVNKYDIHPNELAHKITAEAIYKKLVEFELIK